MTNILSEENEFSDLAEELNGGRASKIIADEKYEYKKDLQRDYFSNLIEAWRKNVSGEEMNDLKLECIFTGGLEGELALNLNKQQFFIR